jgi:NTP pyrophosphatase (non-canonical NTP hydrolase)
MVKYDTKRNMGVYYTCLGLGEEAGEVCGVISKIIRDNGHKIEQIHREKILKELGDVLFYSARLADELGIDLKSIITNNVKKLEGRLARNVIHGSGSDR